MARTKPKYAPEPDAPAQISFVPAGLPYSFDLKGAVAYTDFSVTDIRAAITSGQLPVVSDKPYRILRRELEKWADSKNHFVKKSRLQQKTAA